jgi:hypothetical protein
MKNGGHVNRTSAEAAEKSQQTPGTQVVLMAWRELTAVGTSRSLALVPAKVRYLNR